MSSLSQAMMRRPPQDQRLPPSSYDHLADTWIQAISKYERDTGVKLLDPSIASFDSADKIVAYVEEQEQQFLQFRASGHPRLRERIEPIATIVSRLCDCLGEAVISPVSPVRVIFASFKVAVETAVKLKEDYDAIVDAFDSIKFYLDFLEPVTGSRYYEKLHAPTVELLAHVLVVIGVVTKTRRDRRFKGWWKKLCGNKDVAVAMAKLQDLALKQHHAMSAMTLHGVEQNTALLQGGFSSTIREQEIQRRHLTHIEYQIQEVAHRTMFSAVNYVQIDVGVLEDMQLALLVQSFQTFEAIYGSQINGSA
ncbi:hypothetical protein BD626DRAFT_576583 [Schizophyllum amplum]|uniref:Fungal STAND N-terminal Goodbye domain-containing protein n=1 Tax=Schizophyllum amplum TaxID=97359 RepID=A0A550BT91_9AGAR|nr:hypothetical protein BD626DRAFT_576583 [Auriculariopsis ampla]